MSVNVIFRKDRNKWVVDYHFDGKRRRPMFNEESKARDFARKISLGLSPECQDCITIEDACKKYFDLVSSKKNPKSKTNDRRYFNLFFHFMTAERGIEYLQTVELEDVEAFRDWLPDQTEYDHKPMAMGPASVNRCLAVIKHFFKKQVHWKNRKDTPCQFLEFLDAEPGERPAMTKDQFDLMFAAAPEWFRPVLRFIYLTGAPPSSVERLTWDDVDLVQRRFFLLRKKGRRAKLKRIPLPMTDDVFALFVSARNHSSGACANVFTYGQGRVITADRISKVGNAAIRAAGLEGVTLYSLRHALAADLTDANVATEIVRQAMGHENISTTQRYANKLRDTRLRAITGALDLVRGDSLVTKTDERPTH